MAAEASSIIPEPDVSALLNGTSEPNCSLEEFLNSWCEPASWDVDFPADMPPLVQPNVEAGTGSKVIERPLPTYGNKNAKQQQQQQTVEQRYQVPGSWPQHPYQVAPHPRPGSSHAGSGHMHQMSTGPPSYQQFNAVHQGPAGLTRGGSAEMHGHMPPGQAGMRQGVMAYGNMQSYQQRDVMGPHQYLQRRPLMMPKHALQPNHVRSMSPSLQHSLVPSETPPAAAMHGPISATPLSNQLHNLQAMVNNQANMMHHHNHVGVSQGFGPNGSGGLSDPVMHAKMGRSPMRVMHGGDRHSEAHLFQSPEYLQQTNVMHRSGAHLPQNGGSGGGGGNLPDRSAGTVAHPAAAGFRNQLAHHGAVHGGQPGQVAQQRHVMANHAGMTANQPLMMPAQPELRPIHFSGRSHEMGMMSPVHRGMIHSSGSVRGSPMGVANQQMMMQPHPGRNAAAAAMPQSQPILDKNAAPFQWNLSNSTADMMMHPVRVQNAGQACSSPALKQFPSTVSPAAVGIDHTLSGGQYNAPFTADLNSLSFLSDPFLPQVPDDRYCGQQQMLQPTSTAGTQGLQLLDLLLLLPITSVLSVCLWVCGWVCVCGSVTTITRNCMHRSSPNWVYR